MAAMNAPRVSGDRDFYRKMARHELDQARRYASTDAARSARALKRCRQWRHKVQAKTSTHETKRPRLVLVKS